MLPRLFALLRLGFILALEPLGYTISLSFLISLAVTSTLYIYFYPVLSGCAFPVPSTGPVPPTAPSTSSKALSSFLKTLSLHLPPSASWLFPALAHYSALDQAPFRLLALGDPQLEGDTSIPNAYGPLFPHLGALVSHLTFHNSTLPLRHRIRFALHEIIDFWFDDLPNLVIGIHKRIDLPGNDFYLAHIYRNVHWWTRPTHVTVLGDLVGSQWISDDEFDRRGERFWKRIFAGAERVPDEEAFYPSDEWLLSGVWRKGKESTVWPKRLINIPGNHDIGYAGELNEERLERFIRVFGQINYELRFELELDDPVANATIYDPATNPSSNRLAPEFRMVMLNNMNLDTPVWSRYLQDDTYAFLNTVIQTSSAVDLLGHFTLVLTHVPLYKPVGICADGPLFLFHKPEEGGGVREQNQLSSDASRGFLEGIYGMSSNREAPGLGLGRPGLILNGHDHEGCDTYHYVNQSQAAAESGDQAWQVAAWAEAQKDHLVGAQGVPGIREITVRSMMGDFGGNSGLLSVWFDQSEWRWRHEFTTCSLGNPRIWWATHFLDLFLIAFLAYSASCRAFRRWQARRGLQRLLACEKPQQQ